MQIVNIKRLTDYENGHLDNFQVIDLFQDLINSGLAWELQGHYGRKAAELLNAKECTLPGTDPTEEDDDVYAMHGIDDGPESELESLDKILRENGIYATRQTKHIGAIWGQEPE